MAGQQELLALPPLMVLPPDQVTPQYLLEQLNTLVRHLNARFSSVEDTLQAVRIIQNNIVTMQPDRNILGMSDLFALPYVVIERAITDRMLDKTEPPAPAGITLTTGTVTSPTGVTVPWVEARWTGITASEEPLLSHYQVNFVIDGVPLVVKTRESVARLGDAPGAPAGTALPGRSRLRHRRRHHADPAQPDRAQCPRPAPLMSPSGMVEIPRPPFSRGQASGEARSCEM